MSKFTIKSFNGYSKVWLDDFEILNQKILEGFNACRETPDDRTHSFYGRYENTYIKAHRIDKLEEGLLQIARTITAKLHNTTLDNLKSGFWFNEMQQGDITTRHNHQDDDEIQSCVYYLKVPDGSGELILWIDDEEIKIHPEEGMFVFFHPALDHEVTRQEGSEMRLSLAMNFGLHDAED